MTAQVERFSVVALPIAFGVENSNVMTMDRPLMARDMHIITQIGKTKLEQHVLFKALSGCSEGPCSHPSSVKDVYNQVTSFLYLN